MNKIGYSYSDCSIVPAIISKISSRSQCNPYDKNNMLPIFGSTMDCVANVNNQDIWIENKIKADQFDQLLHYHSMNEKSILEYLNITLNV